jgi:signal transduction histidine kinase
MDLLAGAAFCWCVVYLLLSCFFAILASRRSADQAAYRVFALACVAVSAYALGNALQYHLSALDPGRAATWGMRAFAVLPMASALMLHTSMLYGDVPEPARRRLSALVYPTAAGLTVAVMLGVLHRVGQVSPRVLVLGAGRYVLNVWAPAPAQPVGYLLMLAAVFGGTALLVRAYVTGQREALLACVGAFVLVAAAVNDVLVLLGVHHSIFLVEHGFSAFAFGLSFTLLARHERVSDELTANGTELRLRARELRKSYEDLRAAQEELVRKEQLTLVGELAAVMSHEVRNPLAIISNAVAGLRREGLPADDRATLLSILEEETERLNRLVGDLLRYAKPLSVERQRLDLDALLARAEDLAAQHADIRVDVAIEWQDDADHPPVYGEANMLRQVFDNLVQNACQAMHGGGTLTIRARSSTEDGVEGVAVEFADTGEGMDTQVRSRAGTPFFTTRPGGTGLGLAICDRIVTAHGGVLAINSRSGEGTVVSVFLPTHVGGSGSMPSTVPPSRPSADPSSSRIRGTS